MKTLPAIAMGLMLATLFPLLAAAEPPRLALLVGVSKYQPGPDAWRELHTEKDIDQMKEVLVRHHGFQEAAIRTLRNEQATGDAIRRAFRVHLIDKASPGAVVVFHFSGHGQQILDDSGDELDGLDESLVPYDTASQRASVAAQTNIRDDEIGRWLQALRQKMTTGGKLRGSINVFIDSCYSGTATRGNLIERGRAWNVDLDGPLPTALTTGLHKGTAGLLPVDEAMDGGFILLSAARSYQTAKEVDGRGAFSQALIHALARVGPGATMRTVFERVSDEVAGRALFQDPVFEGPIDTLLFSGTAIAQLPYLPVAADPMQPGLLRLPVGEVHGTTVGSVYAVYQAGSALFSAKDRLGEAVVESVESFASLLKLRQKRAVSQLVAARAVEIEHAHAGRKLRVHLANLDFLPTLRAELLKLPGVEAATGTTYQVQIAYDAPTKRLLVRRASSAQLIAELSAEEGASLQIERLLRGEWRWQYLSSLIANNDTLRVEVQLVPVQAVKEADGPGQGQVVQAPIPRRDISAGRHVCLHSGDFFQLRFHNPSPDPRFVTLLELNPSGEIDVLFPDSQRPDDSRLATGTHQPAHRPYVFEVTNPPGTTRYLAIATAQPVDFQSLIRKSELSEQLERPAQTTPQARAARAWAPGPLNPLAELLRDAAATKPLDRKNPIAVPPTSWATTEAWLEVPAEQQTCPRN